MGALREGPLGPAPRQACLKIVNCGQPKYCNTVFAISSRFAQCMPSSDTACKSCHALPGSHAGSSFHDYSAFGQRGGFHVICSERGLQCKLGRVRQGHEGSIDCCCWNGCRSCAESSVLLIGSNRNSAGDGGWPAKQLAATGTLFHVGHMRT